METVCCRYRACDEHFPQNEKLQERVKALGLDIRKENELCLMEWVQDGKLNKYLDTIWLKIQPLNLTPQALCVLAAIQYGNYHEYYSNYDNAHDILRNNWPKEFEQLKQLEIIKWD